MREATEVASRLDSVLSEGLHAPKPPFSDASTAARGAKAERVLAALANTKDLRYFHDDGCSQMTAWKII